MKKTLLIIFILFAALSLTTSSCSKEETKTPIITPTDVRDQAVGTYTYALQVNTLNSDGSITAVGSTNTVTATALNGSGVTVTGVNLADILAADVSIRAVTTGAVATGTIVVSGQTATQFTLVNSTIGAGSYYLRVTDASDSDNQKVISYKRFTVS